jgi:hypothetical protein
MARVQSAVFALVGSYLCPSVASSRTAGPLWNNTQHCNQSEGTERHVLMSGVEVPPGVIRNAPQPAGRDVYAKWFREVLHK